jgi:hypothetical protein
MLKFRLNEPSYPAKTMRQVVSERNTDEGPFRTRTERKSELYFFAAILTCSYAASARARAAA